MNHIDTLRKLTNALPKYPPPVAVESGFVEIKMTQGNSFGWNLHNEDTIAVAKWFNSKDSIFPKHQHQEREWLIVYKGEMILHVSGETKHLRRGDFVYLEPGTIHDATFPTDCWYVAITIPASEDWPK
jgi:quercetin dioxygenase-like cupin family protein